MRIYITRHGETEWNLQGRMQGWQNSNLTQKGVANAKKLGESLKNTKFERIYSSPLGRAYDTAMYIRGDRDIEIITDNALREMGFGTWEGMPHEEIKARYPEQRINFWENPHLYEPVDGETFAELFERIGCFLERIIKEPVEGNILVVTHAAAIKAVYGIVKGHSLEEFWGPPYMHDTNLSILEVMDEGMGFILEADISHLDED